MDVDPQDAEKEGASVKNPRKRPQPPPDEENEDDMVDSLLPAAAAMKRRKLEEQEEAQRRGLSTEPSFGKSQKKPDEPVKKRPPQKELNIKEVVRSRREAAEEAARRDEESLHATPSDIAIASLKNLAVVEEMDLPSRPHANGNGNATTRWDERWNGRKNFKKFRRAGDGEMPRRTGQSVIVPLEEVKKKEFGIGDEYWLESDKAKKKRREKGTQSQGVGFATQEGRVETLEEEEDGDGDEGGMAEVVDRDVDLGASGRMGRGSRRHGDNLIGEGSVGNGVGGANSNGNTNGKRNASAGGVARGAGAAANKKQKIFAVRDEESESEEDELKFRFKRRR